MLVRVGSALHRTDSEKFGALVGDGSRIGTKRRGCTSGSPWSRHDYSPHYAVRPKGFLGANTWLTLPSNGHTTAGHVCALSLAPCRCCVPLMSNVRQHYSSLAVTSTDLTITFRPLREADLPLLHDWIHRPHVAQWLGGGDAGENLEDTRGSTCRDCKRARRSRPTSLYSPVSR